MVEALCDFAKNELYLSEKLSDGSTREATLESVWQQTGVMPSGLAPVEVPVEALYLWHYFLVLNARRSSNGYSANPITNAEIVAWQQLTGVELEPWEIDVLDGIEHVYLMHQAEKAIAKEKR